MNKNDYIEIINDYLNSNILNYAILIKGGWGCGKSYFVKNDLKNQINDRKILTISLFGMESRKEIDSAITSEYLIENGDTKGIVEKIISGRTTASKAILNKFGVDFEEILIPILFKKMKEENFILVFDDLERSNLDINEILGIINDFVENKGFKVIIIANEDELIKKKLSDNIELKYIATILNNNETKMKPSIDNESLIEMFSEDTKYKIIKEKVIGKTIDFSIRFEDTLEEVISNIKINNIKEIIKRNN